jgi:hypothetical protein
MNADTFVNSLFYDLYSVFFISLGSLSPHFIIMATIVNSAFACSAELSIVMSPEMPDGDFTKPRIALHLTVFFEKNERETIVRLISDILKF